MSYWKRFYYFGPEPQKFYEAADSGGSGGSSGQEPTKQEPESAPVNNPPNAGNEGEFVNPPTNVIDFLKNAPVVENKSEEKPGESTQQNATGTSDEPQQKPENVIKIGDEEFTIDQIQEFRRAYEDREKWQKNLTQRSQLDRWFQNLPPEKQEAFLARAIADVYAQQEPETQIKDEPFSLTIEDDEEGFEYEVELKPGTEEYQKLEKYFEERFKEKYKNAFLELKQHQERYKEFQQEVELYQKRVGQQKALEFLKRHPELGLQIPQIQNGFDLEQYLGEIIQSGNTHPYYDAAMRVINLAQIAAQNGWDLEKAYEYMYGEFLSKQKEAQKIANVARKNQQGIPQETPGQGMPNLTDDQKFLDKISGANPLSDLLAEAEKNMKKI